MDGKTVRGGRGSVGCLYVEERGCRPGGRDNPSTSPEVMEINLLMLSNGDKLYVIYETTFTGPDSVPIEVTRAWNQERSVQKKHKNAIAKLAIHKGK